ncbi:hypothetical protein [Amycolatopsis sp. NPDC004079]|uniref:hypothetical protein n=1 Tax=Amycolatopsis sp. NPDC004079 TaxID=3154549 RepID=UPI0033A29DE3
MSSMIGKRVEYRGGVENAHGLRFVVALERCNSVGDTLLVLETYAGRVALRDVRLSDVVPVPEGPRHQVQNPHGRAQAVQHAFARRSPAQPRYQGAAATVSALHKKVQDLIDAKRPVEAEYWLVQAEQFVGIITASQLDERVQALNLKIAGDDESWLP